MTRPKREVGDIVRRYGIIYRQQYAATLSIDAKRILSAIELCRTAALGGHVEHCDQCSHQRVAYDSCRNRHCPKCQSLARAAWLEQRQNELLDCPYFHLVFTLPKPIADIAYQNKRLVYGLLFSAAAETLRVIGADPKHLGAELGALMVLHTWGQTLMHHPHVHCIVPGGGVSADGERWISARRKFFLSVKVLSRYFRGCFLRHLERAYNAGRLSFFSSLTALEKPHAFRSYIVSTRAKDWVVYAKAPFAGPQKVLNYLARYTHRVAISNHRLLNIDDGNVQFRWRDYRDHNRKKVMTLTAAEFLRRFLLHALPGGFQRIRYYGFLANRYRKQKLVRCRALLGMASASEHAPATKSVDYRDRYEALTGVSLRECPVCVTGTMRLQRRLSPQGRAPPSVVGR